MSLVSIAPPPSAFIRFKSFRILVISNLQLLENGIEYNIKHKWNKEKNKKQSEFGCKDIIKSL